jgi:hypothetical protein
MKYKIAKTKSDYELGLLKGVNVFPFNETKNHAMTMKPKGKQIKYPVAYKGLTNGKVSDLGIALPNQKNFSVYGDTVIEYPIAEDYKFQTGDNMSINSGLKNWEYNMSQYPYLKNTFNYNKMGKLNNEPIATPGLSITRPNFTSQIRSQSLTPFGLPGRSSSFMNIYQSPFVKDAKPNAPSNLPGFDGNAPLKEESNVPEYEIKPTPQGKAYDPYKVHTSDIPLASMAYNTILGLFPTKEKSSNNRKANQYLSGLGSMRYNPDYSKIGEATNNIGRAIRSSVSSVPGMMAGLQASYSDLRNKIQDEMRQAYDMNRQNRQTYLTALNSEGISRATEERRVNTLNQQHAATSRAHLAETLQGIDQIRKLPRQLNQQQITDAIQEASVNAANPDFKFFRNPNTSYFDYYYRDPATNEWKPMKKPNVNVMSTPGIIRTPGGK